MSSDVKARERKDISRMYLSHKRG